MIIGTIYAPSTYDLIFEIALKLAHHDKIDGICGISFGGYTKGGLAAILFEGIGYRPTIQAARMSYMVMFSGAKGFMCFIERLHLDAGKIADIFVVIFRMPEDDKTVQRELGKILKKKQR